jgi:hypothetical protein
MPPECNTRRRCAPTRRILFVFFAPVRILSAAAANCWPPAAMNNFFVSSRWLVSWFPTFETNLSFSLFVESSLPSRWSALISLIADRSVQRAASTWWLHLHWLAVQIYRARTRSKSKPLPHSTLLPDAWKTTTTRFFFFESMSCLVEVCLQFGTEALSFCCLIILGVWLSFIIHFPFLWSRPGLLFSFFSQS